MTSLVSMGTFFIIIVIFPAMSKDHLFVSVETVTKFVWESFSQCIKMAPIKLWERFQLL